MHNEYILLCIQLTCARFKIGSAVYDVTKGTIPSNIGLMLFNCLIFQDVIAKMNWTMIEKENWERQDVGRMRKSPNIW